MLKFCKTFIAVSLLLVLIICLSACSQDGEETQEKKIYSVCVEGGYINDNPTYTEGMFEDGEEITLTPVIPAGKKFLKWCKTGVPNSKLSGEEIFILKVGSARNITAVFTDRDPDIFSLSVSNGYINGNKEKVSGKFETGTEIEVTASFSSLQYFDGWYENGELVSEKTTYQFVLDKSRTLIAKSTDMRLLNVSVKGGFVNCSGKAVEGDEITFTAFDNEKEIEFEKWSVKSGDITTEYTTKSVTLNVTENTQAEALYYEKVPVTAFVYGTSDIIDRVFIRKNSGSWDFEAPLLSGKTFLFWKDENGNKIDNSRILKIQDISSSKDIFAVYTEVEEGFSKVVVANGALYSSYEDGKYSGKLGSEAVIALGTRVFVKPDVAESDVLAEGIYSETGAVNLNKAFGYPIVLSSVMYNIECPELISYNISVSNGYINAMGGKISGLYPEGSTLKAVTQAPALQIFDGWYENNSLVSKDMAYSFTVSCDRVLEARFTDKPYCSVSVSGGTINSSESVIAGTSVTFTATNDMDRLKFDKWVVSTTLTPVEYTSRTITLTITSDTQATAVFTEKILVSSYTEGAVQPFERRYIDKKTGKTLITAPEKDGYTFTGWKDRDGNIIGSEKQLTVENLLSDKDVFACYYNVTEGYSLLTVRNGEIYKEFLNGIYLYRIGKEAEVKIGDEVYIKPSRASTTVTTTSIFPSGTSENLISAKGYKFIPEALSYEIVCSVDIMPDVAPVGTYTTTVNKATQQMDTGIALTAGNTYIVECQNEINYGAVNIFAGSDYMHYTRVFAGNKIVCFRPLVSGNLKLFNCSAYAEGTSYTGNIDFSVYEYSSENARNLRMPTEYYVDLSFNPEEGYNSFTQAIMDLIDDERGKTVYLNSGSYDIFMEYHDFDMPVYEGTNPTEEYSDYCAHIPTNTHVKGIGDVKVVWMPNPEKTDLTMLESETVSPINVFGSCILENFEIYCKNGRYCIHDDPFGDIRYTGAVKIYKDIKCYRYQNDTDKDGNEYGFNGCIGFGMDSSMHYEFINCVFQDFETDGAAFYMHDRCLLNNKTQLVPTEESSEVFVYNCQLLLSENANTGNAVELYNERPMYSSATGERVNVKWTGEAYNNNEMPIRHCRVYFEKTYIDGRIALLGTKGGGVNVCYNAYDLTLVDCNRVEVHYDDTQHNQYYAKFYDTENGIVFISGRQATAELSAAPDTVYKLEEVGTLKLSLADGYDCAEISISFMPDGLESSVVIVSDNANETAPFDSASADGMVTVSAVWNNGEWDILYSY